MFRNLSGQLAAAAATGGNTEKKTMSPTLRGDMYSAVDKTKAWIAGGTVAGQAGDGTSYQHILSIIQKHFPDTKLGFELIAEQGEISVIVGGVTNMVLELGKWEGMAGAIAMRTWIDNLVNAYSTLPDGSRKEMIAKGITRGINHNSDLSLMSKDFTARIQIISILKSLSSRIYGAGSEEARQAEATLSSRLI
ncbi:hypothetical protein Moror_7902 [Moniliophthora roreri MCA 2997]|uniref:Uncharacterized protein n=1 Tax=Moniliophthora roreri (strain MCA 2997) TaxID=1381753 RepID=V2X8G7_MONRO|nr:hypothetical protein Moror_7902 [Moniliophthora roreri MCA 2997]